MQQRFNTRPYSVRDFEEWYSKGDLVLAPKFQRRSVWNPKARSYLIDTIIRGKPIPKIYMRQEVNPKTRRVKREIVDGQQRLRTVLDFLEDGFHILKTHTENDGGKCFSDLDDETQRDILKYEFSVDLLQDMRDQEIYDIFARLNTYSVTLNAQELRNAMYFGEFKTTVYQLSNEFMTFWEANKIFSDAKILRMTQAEFVSELLIAMSIGIRGRSKQLIDNFYDENDDELPQRLVQVKRFRDTMDIIGGIMGATLPQSKFSEPRLLYPLFASIYHLQYGLPKFDRERVQIERTAFPKLRSALESVDEIFRKLDKQAEKEKRLKAGEPPADVESDEVIDEDEEDERTIEGVEQEGIAQVSLSPEEREFYEAYNVHWVHAENRRIRTRYVCELMLKTLR